MSDADREDGEAIRGSVRELAAVLGPDKVDTDVDVRRKYAADWWPLAQKEFIRGEAQTLPIAVVRPTSIEEVSAVLTWATRTHTPVTPWGAGSGVVGGAMPIANGITLDMEGLGGIGDVDRENLLVTVGAGVRGGDLETRLNALGFTVGHYPQSLHISSVGGWVATLGSGTFSSRYGNIEDMVAGLEVALPTGEILRTKVSPRRSVGPPYDRLWLGSEGTLGVVTEVTLRIWPLPESREFRALSFPTFGAGLAAVRTCVQRGLRPAVVRLYDPEEGRGLLEQFGHDPSRWLLVLGFDGPTSVVELERSELMQASLTEGAIDLGVEPALVWEQHRFNAAWLTDSLGTEGSIADAIEVSQLWSRMEETYNRLRSAAARPGTQVFGHVSHVYPQGASLYLIFVAHETDDAEAERVYKAIWKDVMAAAIETGASISHHHGVGLQRATWMAAEHQNGMAVLARLKAALDPAGIMNPGKLGLAGADRFRPTSDCAEP